VARIGRSLGVHLILATQKPSGVVNDQIEANSTSKIALKMASEQDSSELLKTADAAHITQPGRGYLKVGQNEVYELFQSGYAGVPYDPDATSEEVIDERLYLLNDFGQTEPFYDPGEAVSQGRDRRELPTQLEAVITEIGQVFERSNLTQPAKPWLPNLEARIVSPDLTEKATQERHLSVPLGLMDIPSQQAQEMYRFDLEARSHTAIFSSPGYGKSTTLQTLVMNLARQNTPEQIQFYLLDFGINGLLPLKNLPHVADIVTLEEDEKLTKMLGRLRMILSERKQALKNEGVATLSQYQHKTDIKFPILVNLLDNYDALGQSKRRDEIDEVLIQLLRDGAALGVYLILTASRYNAIRMNMMSNIQTKLALFLNDESEVTTLFGRERLEQAEIIGRGQTKLDSPVALQVYLPSRGANDAEVLENLEKEISHRNQIWQGIRPEAIPMVPEELDENILRTYVSEKRMNTISLGLNKGTSELESFDLFQGRSLGMFAENVKQSKLLFPFIFNQIINVENKKELIVIDLLNSLEYIADNAALYFDKVGVSKNTNSVKEALLALATGKTSREMLVIINGLGLLVEMIYLKPDEISEILSLNKDNIQLIVTDMMSRVGQTYGAVTNAVKDNIYQILFGGNLGQQHFIENLPMEVKKVLPERNVIHSVIDDEYFDIVIPKEADND
ncbi:MAG: type VII secretion protein EssC, partial [Streptococcaceae bacterium]|nr:type VII secretion protein EssC [Streptococcaceae bacterium]